MNMFFSNELGSYTIGHSNDGEIRYKASSGGIGSAIIKYLLDHRIYGTSMTFVFNRKECRYEPKLINDYKDYNNCGSIYQDTDTIGFIRNNLYNINNGIIVTCMPCQVKAIKSILGRNNINHFIISLCCSGQTTVQGTWCYYKLLGIRKEDVSNIQYRGNGWPSGIQIELKNGDIIKKDNYTYPWTLIHQSLLFRPKRCLFCTKKTSEQSDVSLADPWLKEYIENDKVGNTFVIAHNDNAIHVLSKMCNENNLTLLPSNELHYIKSQLGTIQSKAEVCQHKAFYKFVSKISANPQYRSLMQKSILCMRMHTYIINKIKNIISYKLSVMKMFKSFLNYLYWKRISRKLGEAKDRVYFDSTVSILNPDAVYFGSNVGVGAGTRFLPIKSSVGKVYQPKIVIGDGCQIGKNNSFASIHSITVGKNVLFAGNVHMTDHSHGYEDISLPMFKQPLISKGGISIGDECWLGFGCEILSGVHVGKHCVVAAHAVVTKDVPDYCIVAGNPAKVIKKYDFEKRIWERIK